MKLGVLLDRLVGQGGAEVHTRLLLARAVTQGDEAVLATLEGEAPAGVSTVHVRAPRRRPARDRVFAERGEAALRETGCDVVLAVRHAPRCSVYLPHGGGVLDSVRAWDAVRGGVGVPRRVARALSSKQRYFLACEEAMLGSAAGPEVICVSRALAAAWRARWPASADRLHVVPNGVDAERFRREPFVEAGRALRASRGLEGAYIGLLLAHHPRLKGVDAAVEALSHPAVRALTPAFHLVVGGGVLSGALWRRARRWGVADRLHAVGPLADARPALAAADVLVHPTWHDPCSLVCLEALAMGVPVITTPQNGVRELLGMRGGIVVEEPGNPDALGVAISVFADEELRAETADDARYIATRCRMDTSLDRVLGICRGVAGDSVQRNHSPD